MEVRLGEPRPAHFHGWFFMAVPLGFAIMIVRLIQSLLRDFRSLRDGTPVYEGDKLFD